MTKFEFHKRFYKAKRTATSLAAYQVLVNGKGVREASREQGVDHSAVSKLIKAMREVKL